MSLSKRTHIMLDPAVFELLQKKSEQQKTTVGNLVRNAIDQIHVYPKKVERLAKDERRQSLQEWWDSIQNIREKARQPGEINYKKMVEHGRKF